MSNKYTFRDLLIDFNLLEADKQLGDVKKENNALKTRLTKLEKINNVSSSNTSTIKTKIIGYAALVFGANLAILLPLATIETFLKRQPSEKISPVKPPSVQEYFNSISGILAIPVDKASKTNILLLKKDCIEESSCKSMETLHEDPAKLSTIQHANLCISMAKLDTNKIDETTKTYFQANKNYLPFLVAAFDISANGAANKIAAICDSVSNRNYEVCASPVRSKCSENSSVQTIGTP